eukprot:1327899-Prorocentrum_lima.AAC.1
MTSSLVGSEMCIRDSLQAEHKASNLDLMKASEEHWKMSTPEHLGPQDPDAVSYTHLTLPTICSV